MYVNKKKEKFDFIYLNIKRKHWSKKNKIVMNFENWHLRSCDNLKKHTYAQVINYCSSKVIFYAYFKDRRKKRKKNDFTRV